MKNSYLRLVLVGGTGGEIDFIRQLLIYNFEQDYDVIWVASPAEFKSIDCSEIDCLLINQFLFEKSGIEFINEINRRAGNAVPFVLLTSQENANMEKVFVADSYSQEYQYILLSEQLQQAIITAIAETAQGNHSNYHFYNGVLAEEQTQKVAMVAALENAIDNDELYLRYQPIFNLVDQRIIGFEALLRWNHPSLDIIGPKSFMPLAEKSGLSVPIGEWIIKNAAQVLAHWQKTVPGDYRIFIKITERQLQEYNLVECLADAVASLEIDTRDIVIEVTGQAVLANLAYNQKVLESLSELGCQVCLDGAGDHFQPTDPILQQIPCEMIKISHVLTKTIDINESSQKKVATLLKYCQHNNKPVIAAGIENQKQLKILQQVGCQVGQGYMLGLPIKPQAVIKLLQTMNSLAHLRNSS